VQPSAADHANQEMVDRLVALGALWTPQLLAAFRATPRHHFLERVYLFRPREGRWRSVSLRGPAAMRLVYSDRALVTHLGPAGPLSSSSQPSLMAQMLEDLEVGPGHRVLEVGAGTGYNAALLAHAAGPGRVTSVDVDRDVLGAAERHLRHFAERAVRLVHADGRVALPDETPFDRVLVTAAAVDLEPAWLAQADGGRVVAPLSLAPGLAFVASGEVRGGVFTGRLTRPAYFVPLRAEGESGAQPAAFGVSRSLRVQPAAWAGWFDGRMARAAWPGFVRGLAFFGWLRGLRVVYLVEGGRAIFGVADAGGAGCLMGLDRWRVAGGGGDLAWDLLRAYLDAGAPSPTEYELTASTEAVSREENGPSAWTHRGPRCVQAWRLPAKRQR
jgi:protein-L-isoaspartate(D-aspartate) O-methyltransferase